VIAEHRLRSLRLDEPADHLDDGWTIGTAIHEVADENEAPALRVLPLAVVAQVAQDGEKCFDFAVDVAEDVEGAIEKRLYERSDHYSTLMTGLFGT
jgi:hypothetical protein